MRLNASNRKIRAVGSYLCYAATYRFFRKSSRLTLEHSVPASVSCGTEPGHRAAARPGSFLQVLYRESLYVERNSRFAEGHERARQRRVFFHVVMRGADTAPCMNNS